MVVALAGEEDEVLDAPDFAEVAFAAKTVGAAIVLLALLVMVAVMTRTTVRVVVEVI